MRSHPSAAVNGIKIPVQRPMGAADVSASDSESRPFGRYPAYETPPVASPANVGVSKFFLMGLAAFERIEGASSDEEEDSLELDLDDLADKYTSVCWLDPDGSP